MKIMKTKTTIIAAAVGMMALTAACSDPALPAAPVLAPPTITETFTGTLSPLTTNMHTFPVNQVGGVRVTLDDVEPAAALGIGIGTPSTATATCLVVSSITAVAGTTTLMSGPPACMRASATVSGNFCISVSDVGNLVEPVTYSISVFHS